MAIQAPLIPSLVFYLGSKRFKYQNLQSNPSPSHLLSSGRPISTKLKFKCVQIYNYWSWHCTTYFQCCVNGNFRSRLWLKCSEAKFNAMGRHTNNAHWRKNWVSCLLKFLSNCNFKLENHAIFYDFHAGLLIVPMCANLVRERSLKPNILLNYLISSFQKCNFFFFRSSFKQYDGF